MYNYYSKHNIGGYINSKIEHQDSVAAIYALELLDNSEVLGVSFDDFCIKCENDDDIEIINDKAHVFIQVKSSNINKTILIKILEDFQKNAIQETEKENFFVISTFENVKYDNINFTDRLNQYHDVLKNKYESDKKKQQVKDDFLNSFNLHNYSKLIDNLNIDTRPLLRDHEDTKAVFARYLRKAYGFKNYREEKIDTLFITLCNEFAILRRKRGNIDKSSIESLIGKQLCKYSWYSGVELELGYKKVKNGYIRDRELEKKRNDISEGARKAIKKILKQWRKTYFKEFLFSQLFGAKKCPECGHPMIANTGGLNGIACSDCGYNPYVTLVLFCECGQYEVLKLQPDIQDDSIFNYLNNYFKNRADTHCKSCGRDLLDDYVELRTAIIPIPIPFDEYKNIDIIYENSKY